MTAPFVTTLRARPGVIRLGDPGEGARSIRVQLAHAWDAVRVEASPSESIHAIKVRALEELDPAAGSPDRYVVTYRGVEIPDERASLSEAGIANGGTLLVALRRRRAVR